MEETFLKPYSLGRPLIRAMVASVQDLYHLYHRQRPHVWGSIWNRRKLLSCCFHDKLIHFFTLMFHRQWYPIISCDDKQCMVNCNMCHWFVHCSSQIIVIKEHNVNCTVKMMKKLNNSQKCKQWWEIIRCTLVQFCVLLLCFSAESKLKLMFVVHSYFQV